MFGRNEGSSAAPPQPPAGAVVASPDVINAMKRLLRIDYLDENGVRVSKTVECISTMLSGSGALMIQTINFVLGDPVQQCVEAFADGQWKHFEDVTPAPQEPSRLITE